MVVRHARYVAAWGCVVLGAACTPAAPAPPPLDAAKVSSVVIGRSSRADVFAALGRPGHTEQSQQGETWVYETQGGGSDNQDLSSGASTVAGVIGAFVPYVGLVGSGLGLASSAMGSQHASPTASSLKIMFGEDGVVRDCLYTTTDAPAGMPGAATPVLSCQRQPL